MPDNSHTHIQLDGSIENASHCSGKHSGFLWGSGIICRPEEDGKLYEHTHIGKDQVPYVHRHIFHDSHTHGDGDGFLERKEGNYKHTHITADGDLISHAHIHTGVHQHEDGDRWVAWDVESYWAAYNRSSQSSFLVFSSILLAEAYSPSFIKRKFYTVLLLRLAKAIALVINQQVGRVLCGWNGRENLLLDWIGHRSRVLFSELYHGTQLGQDAVLCFIKKRLTYCVVTTAVTLIQILLTYIDTKESLQISLLFSLLTVPITLVDRQWCTLVTKLSPREERSHVIDFRDLLAQTVKPVCQLHMVRRQSIKIRSIHLLVPLEMFVGFIQTCAAAFLVCFNVTVAFNVEALPGLFALVYIVILVRLVKEATNWISCLLEWYVTPAKYAINERLFRSALDSILGSQEGLGVPNQEGKLLFFEKVEQDPEVLETLAALCFKYLLSSQVHHMQDGNTSNDVECPSREACFLHNGVHHPLQALPKHLQYDYTKEERRLLLTMVELGEAYAMRQDKWAQAPANGQALSTSSLVEDIGKVDADCPAEPPAMELSAFAT
ncbi:hypothetical protein CYMTET_26492 [Cymbomonas tetramitiformis]|uniref:Uncharacterized protein n=1 Tax=Cymbomonas tetramitiformis TaxID=36881 RepID=A0AAE0KY36_9CHLO|nr:hypothetical protein CYMTET_26492 [Cymbomonas tetramitiformis]